MTALPAATSVKTAQAARTGSRGAPSEMHDTLDPTLRHEYNPQLGVNNRYDVA
jgi:hypothetical protein